MYLKWILRKFEIIIPELQVRWQYNMDVGNRSNSNDLLGFVTDLPHITRSQVLDTWLLPSDTLNDSRRGKWSHYDWRNRRRHVWVLQRDTVGSKADFLTLVQHKVCPMHFQPDQETPDVDILKPARNTCFCPEWKDFSVTVNGLEQWLNLTYIQSILICFSFVRNLNVITKFILSVLMDSRDIAVSVKGNRNWYSSSCQQ